MSYYLIDNFNNFDFSKLIIGRKISSDDTISKYFIYYQDSDLDDPKELYIKMPKLRLIYKLGNSKFNQENIPVYPNYVATASFIKFIKNFENNIKTTFVNKFNNCEIVSIIKKKNGLNFIKLNMDDKIKIYSDNKIKNINEFQINSQIELILKVSYIWNKNNLKLGISSIIYQIKYYPSPQELNINFFNTEEKINEKIVPIVVSHEISDTDSIISKHDEQKKPKIISTNFVPSIGDLNVAIKNLKKI